MRPTLTEPRQEYRTRQPVVGPDVDAGVLAVGECEPRGFAHRACPELIGARRRTEHKGWSRPKRNSVANAANIVVGLLGGVANRVGTVLARQGGCVRQLFSDAMTIATMMSASTAKKIFTQLYGCSPAVAPVTPFTAT